MRTQISFGNGLFRVAVFVGLFACLIAEGISSSQAATTEARTVTNETGVSGTTLVAFTCQGDANRSDSMLTGQLESALPDDGIAFEDSIETLRVDVQQRVFGIDLVKIGLKVAAKVAPNARPNVSLPLLV